MTKPSKDRSNTTPTTKTFLTLADPRARRIATLKRAAAVSRDARLIEKTSTLNMESSPATVARVERELRIALRPPITGKRAPLSDALKKHQKAEPPRATLAEALERAGVPHAPSDIERKSAAIPEDMPYVPGQMRAMRELMQRGWMFSRPDDAHRFAPSPTARRDRPQELVNVAEGVCFTVLRGAGVKMWELASGSLAIDVADEDAAREALTAERKRREDDAIAASEEARRKAEARDEANRAKWITLDELAERAGLDAADTRKKLQWFWGQPLSTLSRVPLVLGLPRQDGERLLRVWASSKSKPAKKA